MGGGNASKSPEEGLHIALLTVFFILHSSFFIPLFIDIADQSISVYFISGADTPIYCALLPKGTTSPNGELVSNREILPWRSGKSL